jgi:hypothetical protein
MKVFDTFEQKHIRNVLTSPSSDEIFFGFHDLCPWNHSDDKLLLLRIAQKTEHVPNRNDWADVVVWSPSTNKVDVVGRTSAWNFQQGARQQWLSNGDIVFNCIANGAVIARQVSPEGDLVAEHPISIGDISPCGNYVATANYARLREYWIAYGYDVNPDLSVAHPAPEDDGLWIYDISKKSKQLLHSLASLVAQAKLTTTLPHFVSHPSFSPDGKKIAFLHRFFSADVALYTRLLVCDRDGSNLVEVAKEKVSHFDWYDNESLFVWSRFAAANIAALRAKGYLNNPLIKPLVNLARKFRGRLKSSLLSEHYYHINVNNVSSRRVVASSVLTEDGHPMFHPIKKDIFVTDTYPKKNGCLSLMLGNIETQKVVLLGEIPDGVETDNSDLKCDLHPRWNRAGTAVGLDVSVDGRRSFVIVELDDVSRILS